MDPETPPDVAVIVVVPAATGVANPSEPVALLIVATPVVDELQVTVVVRFCVELSEYVPVAVNCRVVPSTTLGLAGVTAMETSVAAVTVSVVDPETPPDVAVIVVVPAATGVANPSEPAALLIVATPVVDELQVTVVVRFCVVPSENVPVAVNCLVVPLATLGLVGVTAMETSVAAVTVRVVDPDMSPDVAVTVVLPTPLPFAFIYLGLLADTTAVMSSSIVTTVVSDELQVTDAVRSCVVLSE